MWAMIEKLRMRSIAATKGRGPPPGRGLDATQQPKDLVALRHPEGEDRAEVGGGAGEERRAQGDDLGERVAAERVVEEHSEQDGHEELYFVASGRATFVLGDEEIDAPAGTFIHAEPGTRRGAVATEPDTTVLAIGAKPGVPHEISGTTPREEWLDVDDALAAELRERLAKLGYEGELEEGFTRWTWQEGLEDRVDGIEQIDPVVLEALRSRT